MVAGGPRPKPHPQNEGGALTTEASGRFCEVSELIHHRGAEDATRVDLMQDFGAKPV